MNKKFEYARNKRIAMCEKKSRRAKIIADGNEDRLCLYFFFQTLKDLDYKIYEVAEKSGYSQQLISYWKTVDDCKLSNIIKCFNSLNINLSVRLEPIQYYNPVISGPKYVILAENIEELRKKTEENRYVAELVKRADNLRFLAEYIHSQRLSLVEFSKKCKLSYGIIYRDFQKDDMKISLIYDIAHKTHQEVVWSIKPLSK